MAKNNIKLIFTTLLVFSTFCAAADTKLSSQEKNSEEIHGMIEKFTHGGSAWAVYVAVDKAGSDTLKKSENNLKYIKNIAIGTGELSCDHGAAKALGISDQDDLYAVAVYFKTEEAAKKFVTTLSQPPRGIAKVETYCAD